MSEAAIRAQLNTVVSAVSNVGKVHDYERWYSEWPDFETLYKTTISSVAQIRGWDIGYRGFTPSRDPQFNRYKIHNHTFWVQGYLGLKDADGTEKTASALAIAVCNAIDSDSTLHSGTYYLTPPVALENFEPRMFGSVLCHYARIVVSVPEQVS